MSEQRPPRVVLFRANSIDVDSRAKKLGLSLARLGYDVVLLSAEEPGADTTERRLGPVRVVPVVMTRTHRDAQRHKLAARRLRQFRVVDWTPTDEYVTQVAELRRQVRAARRRAAGLGSQRSPVGLLRLAAAVGLWASARGRLRARTLRWKAQWLINVGHRTAWRRWDALRVERSFLATTRGMLPEVEDYATSFAPVLNALEPDLIHAHHPMVLGTAVRAARRRRAAGADCRVVYDAREDFLGMPHQEQGHWRRYSVIVREEARYIRQADAVLTVSEPIAQTLAERYGLTPRPSVVLNVPVDDVRIRPGAVDGPTVRDVVGVEPQVPLLVYSGAVSEARGVDVLIDALPHLPQAHAVIVPVPYPHPHQRELTQRAEAAGVADRLHFCPPVGQDRLLHYLSGADLGVMPLRTGSANIEHALPNKLFENLHAGLTMVTSDAKLMAAFVTENDLGEVFRDGDAADLAAAVRRALANPRDGRSERWEALRRRYSWQGQEPALRELYQRLAPAPTPDGIDDPVFGSLVVTQAPVPQPPEPHSDHGSGDSSEPVATQTADVLLPVGTNVHPTEDLP